MASLVRGSVWCLSLLPIAVTLLPGIRSAAWWVRVWDYPRLQLAVALGAAVSAQAKLLPRDRHSTGLLATTLGCLAWQLFRIYPYTPLARVQVTPADAASDSATLAIIVVNVLQQNRNASALLRRIHDADPDVVLAVETNQWWDGAIASLQERYPHVVRHPLENTYGMHLFSRLPLEDVRVLERVSRDVPSVVARVRLGSGQLVTLYCVHPEPPQPGNDVDERDAELLLVASDVAASRDPAIVCGDLNDVAWSHTTRLFQRISGLLDPRIGRGLYPTFHADHWLARWPLDHIFLDTRFRLGRLAVLGSFGSDHFPVYARLQFDERAERDHESPEADAGDHEEAAEKIGDGLEPGSPPRRTTARARRTTRTQSQAGRKGSSRSMRRLDRLFEPFLRERGHGAGVARYWLLSGMRSKTGASSTTWP